MLEGFLRALQAFGLIVTVSGLIIGIRDHNMMLELQALIIGSGIFYGANVLLRRIK